MIAAFRFVDGLPQQVDDLDAAEWLDVLGPSEQEIAEVVERFGVSEDFLRAPFDIHERPRLEYEGGSTLVLLRLPHGESGRASLIFATRPLAVIITPKRVITCSNTEDLAGKHFRRRSRAVCDTPTAVALLLMLRVGADFIRHLDQLDRRIEDMERTLHDSTRNEELLALLHLEKTLIYFIMALKGDAAVMDRFGRAPAGGGETGAARPGRLAPAENALWEDAMIEIRQASDMAEIYSQTLAGLGDAMGAVVSNNLNAAMKFLTGMTIVLMIPTILAGLYGMNMALPFADNPRAFYVLGGLCAALCAGTACYFRRKNWL